MISGRTLILLAVAAGGYWLWQSGQWRTLAARVPALAHLAGEPAPAATGDITVPAPAAPPPAELAIRTWTDENGVVHFEQTTTAPRNAATYTPRGSGTMADYEKELEAQEGISIEDIARAKAAREAAAAEEAAKQDHTASENAMDVATRQARELMQRYEQTLGNIREENNK